MKSEKNNLRQRNNYVGNRNKVIERDVFLINRNVMKKILLLSMIFGGLLIIFQINQNVSAYGSGEDYPYDGTGDWVIDSDVYIYDENIIMNGSMYIENSGNTDLEFLCIVDPAWIPEIESVIEELQ